MKLSKICPKMFVGIWIMSYVFCICILLNILPVNFVCFIYCALNLLCPHFFENLDKRKVEQLNTILVVRFYFFWFSLYSHKSFRHHFYISLPHYLSRYTFIFTCFRRSDDQVRFAKCTIKKLYLNFI